MNEKARISRSISRTVSSISSSNEPWVDVPRTSRSLAISSLSDKQQLTRGVVKFPAKLQPLILLRSKAAIEKL